MPLRHAAAAVLLVAGACSPGPPSDATGEEIYIQLCAACHAADMSGGIGPPLGAGSEAARQPDEFLEVTIIRGRGRMPSFSSLDEEQVRRVVAHIREVQGR